MHGGLRRKCILEIEVRQQTAMQYPLLVGWHQLELFSVSSRERNRYCVLVSPSWRESETHCLLCVPTLPMFAYYSGAFEMEYNRSDAYFAKLRLLGSRLCLLFAVFEQQNLVHPVCFYEVDSVLCRTKVAFVQMKESQYYCHAK